MLLLHSVLPPRNVFSTRRQIRSIRPRASRCTACGDLRRSKPSVEEMTKRLLIYFCFLHIQPSNYCFRLGEPPSCIYDRIVTPPTSIAALAKSSPGLVIRFTTYYHPPYPFILNKFCRHAQRFG